MVEGSLLFLTLLLRVPALAQRREDSHVCCATLRCPTGCTSSSCSPVLKLAALGCRRREAHYKLCNSAVLDWMPGSPVCLPVLRLVVLVLQEGDALRVLRLCAARLEADADADVRRERAGGHERQL